MSSFSPKIPRHPSLAITAGDSPLDVFATPQGAFAFLPFADGKQEIVLSDPQGWEGARLAPQGAAEISGNPARDESLCVIPTSDRPFLIERPGLPLVFLFPERHPGEPPKPQGGRLYHFAAGEFHEAGTIRLQDGDVLWIEPGAWVCGHVVASRCRNIVLGGGGVLDGLWRHPDGLSTCPIVLDHCHVAVVQDLTMIRPQSWMLTIGGCEGVLVEGLQQIGEGGGTDGIDIVGSRRVRVRHCFLRNGDDNIAIKALHVRGNASACQDSAGDFSGDWTGPVEDVLVEDCAFYNDCGGAAMEIGYETRTDRISNITFRNIDIMAVHQFGSVFGIHNGDRARVENVLWENIRVEHHYDKLIDLRVVFSRWNRDVERGRIEDVTLREIHVAQSPYNTGYTTSLIGGFDADHAVTGVRIENFHLGGKHITCAEDLALFTLQARDINFL